jgi:hypothetical protein
MTREQRLILAVINLAIKDYKNGGKYAKSARAYFAGPVYKHHVESRNKRGVGRILEAIDGHLTERACQV